MSFNSFGCSLDSGVGQQAQLGVDFTYPETVFVEISANKPSPGHRKLRVTSRKLSGYRTSNRELSHRPEGSCGTVVTVKYGAISLLSANLRSVFDSAAHFYGGDTTSLKVPAAVPADSPVRLGPNLLLARFNWKGFFSECFIPSTSVTLEHDNTPVALCVRHNRPLAP